MGCRRNTQGTGMATVETEAVETEKAVEESEKGVKEVALVAEVVKEAVVAVIRSRLQHANCLRDRR